MTGRQTHRMGTSTEGPKEYQPIPQTDLRKGLSVSDIPALQAAFGPNSLDQSQTKSVWLILANQFKSLLTLLLFAAAVLSFLFGDMAEGLAILVVIIINSAIGFWAEHKADRSMAALRQMGKTTTRVRRDGKVLTVPSESLVPGDVVLLEAGDIVPADIALAESTRLQSDESLLTGESVPVEKAAGARGEPPTSAGLVFKGASITRGTALGVVTATGWQTELGQIADLAEQAEGSTSPLEKRLGKLTEQLLLIVVGLMAALIIFGIAAGRDSMLMIKTGVALAVAAIPEGLPIVATLALARGMWRLAERNALIERLSAVETLGSVTTIISDKTGTLTENQMKVMALETPLAAQSGALPDSGADRAYRVCALCFSGEDVGHLADPMERALVDAAANAGFTADKLSQSHPRLEEEPFDPDIRMMATRHQSPHGNLLLVKGAPEAALAACSHIATGANNRSLSADDRNHWLDCATAMASKGLRVLALAEKTGEALAPPFYQGLTFVGLVGLEDPPRADAAAAVRDAQSAGIQVVMATGDNACTATNIAEAVGIRQGDGYPALEGGDLADLDAMSDDERKRLLGTAVFARMTPRHKLDLIDFYQKNGAVVAMTGDGVNDAPALKKADVGIAMGQRGTEVAKEAAAMILRDDAFASIVVAVQQGRVIFSNIRKFVIYLLSCNLSEVLVVTLSILFGLPLALLPLQILFLNLVTDVFPALALGFGKGDAEILHRPPRPKSEGLLQPRHWQAIVGYALMMTAAVYAAFLWALAQPDKPPNYAGTVAFMTLATGQLWHVFNMRSRKAALLRNQVMSNIYVWLALGLCLALLTAAGLSPFLRSLLALAPLDLEGLQMVLGMGLLPLLLGQVAKQLAR